MNIHFFFNGIQIKFDALRQIQSLDGNVLNARFYRYLDIPVDRNRQYGTAVVIEVLTEQVHPAWCDGEEFCIGEDLRHLLLFPDPVR